MSEEERPDESPEGPPHPRARRSLPDHPVRVALLDLLAEAGTVTSSQAAAHLGYSSGLCSFHLRQLAAHGLIEEAPHEGGRARPWRLRWETPLPSPEGAQPRPGTGTGPEPDGGPGRSEGPERTSGPGPGAGPAEFATLARGLEDESYRHWLADRDRAPAAWRRDETFSEVVHLTPEEMSELADSVRRLLAGYRERDRRPGARPGGTAPVAVVTRLFPLLADAPARPASPAPREAAADRERAGSGPEGDAGPPSGPN